MQQQQRSGLSSQRCVRRCGDVWKGRYYPTLLQGRGRCMEEDMHHLLEQFVLLVLQDKCHSSHRNGGSSSNSSSSSCSYRNSSSGSNDASCTGGSSSGSNDASCTGGSSSGSNDASCTGGSSSRRKSSSSGRRESVHSGSRSADSGSRSSRRGSAEACPLPHQEEQQLQQQQTQQHVQEEEQQQEQKHVEQQANRREQQRQAHRPQAQQEIEEVLEDGEAQQKQQVKPKLMEEGALELMSFLFVKHRFSYIHETSALEAQEDVWQLLLLVWQSLFASPPPPSPTLFSSFSSQTCSSSNSSSYSNTMINSPSTVAQEGAAHGGGCCAAADSMVEELCHPAAAATATASERGGRAAEAVAFTAAGRGEGDAAVCCEIAKDVFEEEYRFVYRAGCMLLLPWLLYSIPESKHLQQRNSSSGVQFPRVLRQCSSSSGSSSSSASSADATASSNSSSSRNEVGASDECSAPLLGGGGGKRYSLPVVLSLSVETVEMMVELARCCLERKELLDAGRALQLLWGCGRMQIAVYAAAEEAADRLGRPLSISKKLLLAAAAEGKTPLEVERPHAQAIKADFSSAVKPLLRALDRMQPANTGATALSLHSPFSSPSHLPPSSSWLSSSSFPSSSSPPTDRDFFAAAAPASSSCSASASAADLALSSHDLHTAFQACLSSLTQLENEEPLPWSSSGGRQKERHSRE